MNEACETGDVGVIHVTRFLKSIPHTIDILNVENDQSYQKKDIDLIWTFSNNKMSIQKSVEIKSDNYFSTGNYFFETISNKSKNTPGCFMYSEADLLFYYFLGYELHIMNLPKVREWFIKNRGQFKVRTTSTSVNGSRYYTEGSLVKRQRLVDENLVRIVPYTTIQKGLI
jgi:hypothetical protein